MDVLLGIAFIAGVFAAGYWVGMTRTKMKFVMPSFDWKKYEKLKKALDESYQKMQARQNDILNK